MVDWLMRWLGMLLLILAVPLQIFYWICLLVFGYAIYVAPVFLEHADGTCLVDGRANGYHSDYMRPLKNKLKWRWTVLCGLGPPTQDYGNQDYHDGEHEGQVPKPIPPAGEWQLSHKDVKTEYWNVRLRYFAVTTLDSYHIRVGWRWDDLDHFYLFTVSIKWIGPNYDILFYHWQLHRYCG